MKDTVKKAAALRYDPAQDDVPLLTAFGQGYVAERILATAEQAAVPIVRDEGLTNMLAKMSIGDEIPAELYRAVAQILVFISESDHAYGERIRSQRLKSGGRRS